MQGVATRSLYGAFGVPIALLLWMNFIAKLLLYCAAWTATQHVGGIQSYEQQRERRRARDARDVSPGGAASAAAPGT
jgi:membrane protein